MTERKRNSIIRLVVCCLFSAIMLLCLCQPTPDNGFIANKSDNNAEKEIESSPVPVWSGAQPVFPARWEDDIKTEYKEMIIDADVLAGGRISYPVALVRKSRYSKELLTRIGRYMFQAPACWRQSSSPTKEYIAEAMLYVTESDMTDADKEIQLEMLRDTYKTTSISDADNRPCSNFSDIPFADYDSITVITVAGDVGCLGIDDKTGLSVNLHRFGVIQSKSWWKDNDPTAPQFAAGISFDEAEAKAKDFLSMIGIEGFELYRGEEARCIDMFSTEVYSTGWDLRFIRTFGYTPFSASEYDAAGKGAFDFDDSDEAYAAVLRTESIGLYVTENGIESVVMHNPYEYVGMASENVKLMDFDELTAGIKRFFTAGISNPDQSEGYFVIEEMVLTVIPQQKKDSDEAYMMPVWVCKIGSYTSLAEMGLSHFYVPPKQNQTNFYFWTTGFAVKVMI